ncbi:MAG: DUF5615 family PIN-like protein [Candidatus Hydrogenedentes bacterium]|nr:DUF5615 family PIN-like protein [Candidatus Hydrogenedentota bacterium]
MQIKLDENIPARVVDTLERFGHDVATVARQGWTGLDDRTLWTRIREEGRLLITQDLDFSDIRAFAPGSHAGVVLVRLRNPSRAHLAARLLEIFANEDVEAWDGAFIVITEAKIRVILPRHS